MTFTATMTGGIKWQLTADGKFTNSHKSYRSSIRNRVRNNKPLTASQEAFAEWYDNIQKNRSIGGSSSSSDPPILNQNLKKSKFTGAQRVRRHSIRKKESMGIALNSEEMKFLEWYDSNKKSTNRSLAQKRHNTSRQTRPFYQSYCLF